MSAYTLSYTSEATSSLIYFNTDSLDKGEQMIKSGYINRWTEFTIVIK